MNSAGSSMSHHTPATPASRSAAWLSPHHARAAGLVKSGKAHIPGHTTFWYSSPAKVRQYRSLASLDVDGVAVVDLDARVDDRDDAEAVAGQIGEHAGR